MSLAEKLRSFLSPEPALAIVTLAVSVPPIAILAYMFLYDAAHDPLGVVRSIAPYFIAYYGASAVFLIVSKVRRKPGAE